MNLIGDLRMGTDGALTGEGGCTSITGTCGDDGCGGACAALDALGIAPVCLGTAPDGRGIVRGLLGIAPVGLGTAPDPRGELAAAATAAPTAAATASSTVVDEVEGWGVLLGGVDSCTKLVRGVSCSGSGSGALKPKRFWRRFGTRRLYEKKKG